MLKRVKILFFILIFLGISISYTVWAGEHISEPVESGIKKQIEQKQQDLEEQRKQKAASETDLRNAKEREQKATEELSQYGYLSWGFSKVWGGEYSKLQQEQIDAKNARDVAQNEIDTAQKKIDQLQQEMADLSQQYAPAVSTQDISILQNQMNDALKNRDFKSFNDALQQIIEQTPNPADKYDPITNAIDAVVKEYPNDLTAQSDALKQIELTLNLMLGKDYKSNDYKEVINDIVVARQNVQAKIDEHSPWYLALKDKNIPTFRDSLKTLFNQKKTDEDKRILLRDVFNQVSANIAVGSTQWFDALDDIFRYAENIPTEKTDIDLKAELLSSAIDLVDAKLTIGSDDWRLTLNTLYDSYTDPLYYPEIQKRIESELEKQKVKIANVDLSSLLKQGNIADYVDVVDDSVAKLATADAKRELIENQYVTATGELGVNNYSKQVDVLSALSSAVDPTNFAPIDKPKVQDTFNKINDRKEVLEGRIEAGNNNLGDTLQNAHSDIARFQIIGEDFFVANQLHKDVPENPKEGYADQKAVLVETQNVIEPYKGTIFDIIRNDIISRVNEIDNFEPQEPSTAINDLDKKLLNLLPDDQIKVLKQEYNTAIDQLATTLEKNDTNIKNIQDNLQQIKDLIDNDKYAELKKKNSDFVQNIDAAIAFASNVIEAVKPPEEFTTDEKNVLAKLTAGETLGENDLTILAGMGAKKMLAFIASNITPENLAKTDKVASILQKAPTIANIMGKFLKGIDSALGMSNTWYAQVLLAGPTLLTQQVGVPLAKRYLKAQYGEPIIKTIENIIKGATETFPTLVDLTNSKTFQDASQTVATGGSIIESINKTLNDAAQNVNANAAAKNIENIPSKEELQTKYDAVSTLARRLEELSATESPPVEANVPTQQKGFFAQIKDYFSSFVADVKKWITSLFTGDRGIPSLEKKFNVAQAAYNTSKTDANAQALITAAKNLHNAYQEVTGSIATYKELQGLWKNVMMDPDIAAALKTDPAAINMDILNQTLEAGIQSKDYNTLFLNAMSEIGQAVDAVSKGTALEDEYNKSLNQLVIRDYVKDLRDYQQSITALNNAFTFYKSKLQEAIAKVKQPTTPAQGEIPAQGQPDILGTG